MIENEKLSRYGCCFCCFLESSHTIAIKTPGLSLVVTWYLSIADEVIRMTNGQYNAVILIIELHDDSKDINKISKLLLLNYVFMT